MIINKFARYRDKNGFTTIRAPMLKENDDPIVAVTIPIIGNMRANEHVHMGDIGVANIEDKMFKLKAVTVVFEYEE